MLKRGAISEEVCTKFDPKSKLSVIREMRQFIGLKEFCCGGIECDNMYAIIPDVVSSDDNPSNEVTE
jgi:hypothetical protein